MKRYDSYKPSGVSWIGEIPSHWEERKIRSLYAQRSEKVSDKDYEPLSVSKRGITPQLEDAVKTDNGDNRKLVRKGDFVVNSRSDRKGSCGVSEYDGSVSLINIVTYPITNLNSRFFHLLFRSNDYIEEFYRLGKGIVADLWTTKFDEMRNIFVPFPSLEEQNKIVEFLSEKSEGINNILLAKSKILELQKELIENMIFFGGNEGKATINGWGNDFHSDWKVVKGRRIFEEISIKGNANERFIAVTQDRALIYKDEGDVNFVTASDPSTQKLVCPNQFVISLRSFQGGLELSEIRGLISAAYSVFKLKDYFDTDKLRTFFRFLFKSRPYISLLNSLSDSLRDGKSIKFSEVADFEYPLPPDDFLDSFYKEVQKYDILVEEYRQLENLLEEYKQRLIADVVTGQVKVD